ncbi:hypothetical protein Tco_0969571 [Tanacetum coccineum]
MKTPMSSDSKLKKYKECESLDSTKYRGMIGGLLYLTASRPDIMFSVCLCARFQEAPKTSHLEAEIMWIERALASISNQLSDEGLKGACVFTDKWSLDELAYGVPTDGPYQTNPPSPDDIILSIRIDREGQVCRIRHKEEIDVLEYQVLSREIEPTLKPLEEIIQENTLSRVIGSFIMNENPELNNESYVLYDRVMNPLAAQQERKPRKDRGTRRGRHSTSSSSAFDQPSSSHLNDDDDGNGEGTSRASTPSPIRYVNLLTNQVPQVFQNPPNIDPHLEPFYTRQTEIINRQVQIRDEQRGGLRSIGKGLRNLWRNIKK